MASSSTTIGFTQLQMKNELERRPSEPILAQGYVLRRAFESDLTSIAEVLTVSFQEAWDTFRVDEVLLANQDVPTTWVIEWNHTVVATASYQLKPTTTPKSGWVHYVGADPNHSGRGLGLAVVSQVLLEIFDAGHESALLTTDDFRLPAIRTYLKLGFEPDLIHESHFQRWQNVLDQLNSIEPGDRPVQ